MKRKFTAILSAVLCLLFGITAFSACDFLATEPDGRTPYDVAVANGYEGSWESWLARLEGTSSRERELYEEAVASGGFTGTFEDFLKQTDVETDVADTALFSVVSVYAEFSAIPSVLVSVGAGVIYSLDQEKGDAYILTNYHVLYQSGKGESEKIFICLYGNETYSIETGLRGDGAISATLVGKAMNSDIAVLKITGAAPLREQTYRAAKKGNSDAVTEGESAYAAGNPLGEGLSVTRGVVSVPREEVIASIGALDRVTLPEISTDAPIDHGNSGGGLFNSKGEVIGIVNARRETASEENEQRGEGIGYALPANYAFVVAENIIANEGACRVAQLGFETKVLSSINKYDEARGQWFAEEKTVAFLTLSMQSAGYRAGIRNGDTFISADITRADGTKGGEAVFTRAYKLDDFMLRVRKGDTLTVVVSRENRELSFDVKFDKDEYFKRVL